MPEYRRAMRERFENAPGFRSLLPLDAVFLGMGLLFLLLTGFGLLRVRTDLFAAFGFWMFWVGAGLAFIRADDAGLILGLGGYSLLNLILFFAALARAHGSFAGFTPLFNAAAGGLFTYLTIREMGNPPAPRPEPSAPKASPYAAPSGPKQTPAGPETPPESEEPGAERRICPVCGAELRGDIRFCTHCGAKL